MSEQNMGEENRGRTPDADTEGSGAEQGLQEDAGLHDKVAQQGEDTAAFRQDESAAKRPTR